MKTYFVEFRLFNGENGGWAFKEEKFEDFNSAIQKYGTLINQYYGKAPFIFGLIKVEDESGFVAEHIKWGNVIPPTTSNEPTEEVTA